jgi:DNA polymerase V
MKVVQINSFDFPGIPQLIPLAFAPVQAGFPSPAEDYIEEKLDINELVVQNPAATFFVRVQGDSMGGATIFSGDILVVDRSLPSMNGKIVVAILNGEFTVKRLLINKTGIYLVAENPKYPPLKVSDSDFQIWGVVTHIIHKAK